MKVWLVWTGSYSDASVMGVYSSLELAKAAAALHDDGYVDEEEGREVDADAQFVRSGVAQWLVYIEVESGAMKTYPTRPNGPGTGKPAETTHYGVKAYNPSAYLLVRCDARDKDHAIKIAGEERIKWLAQHSLDGIEAPNPHS